MFKQTVSLNKYNPVEEERSWTKGKAKPLPARHHFAHAWVRSRLCDVLTELKYGNDSLVLDVGCGSGDAAVHVQKVSPNIVGIDVSDSALKHYTGKGFHGVIGDVKRLPFRDGSFDCVIAAGLLHHLVGQGNLTEYLTEFTRVTRLDGHVIALEPNLFNHSGLLMNIFNKIKPGITGLVPHERALSPLTLAGAFEKSGLREVRYMAASYVWNRYPLCVSKYISKHEERIRSRKPFNLFGWWEIVYGRKSSE